MRKFLKNNRLTENDWMRLGGERLARNKKRKEKLRGAREKVRNQRMCTKEGEGMVEIDEYGIRKVDRQNNKKIREARVWGKRRIKGGG